MGRLRTPRVSQPQQIVGLDPSNKYAKRVIDGFFGTSGLTLRGKVITDSANITKTVSAAGKVRRGAANAGFSFPCDLTGNNGITIVFQYVQYSRSGTQVLFEHSVDQNTNAGTFIVYTDVTASKLAFGTSADANYDAGTVALPALGDVVTVAVRLRFTASVTASDDIKIWINGVSPAFTSAATTNYAGNFGNYTTYFLSRAASSLRADASASMYAVLSGFASDAELRELSLNPWQLFAPVQRSSWEPVAAGGPVTHDTSGALAGQLGSIAGTAAHVAVHNTNGTPTGQLGSVAGSAARLRAFSSTGALTGQGASIVGSAARAGGATTHDTTGTPTGQGSAVVGTAAHVAIHGTSGTLVGTSALLAGTAVHNIPHGTSGDLTGPGSVVVGSALNGLASVTKSGVNRLWLIDYYTKEFAAKERLRNPEPAKTKVVAKKRAAEVAAKVEASVAKAEKDLATLTKSMKDVQDAQVFIYNAIQQAKQAPQAEPVDFMAVAKRYEKKVQQEEHELLLLAMVL